MEYRKEKDSFGEIDVPAERLWGAQTERSRNNFKIGMEIMPFEIIKAIAQIKASSASANFKCGKLSKEKADIIISCANEIIGGKLKEEFPLVVWQTGSGTQTNMNVNEVIAHLAEKKGIKIHPNDDVNMSQSTNDVFPTAIHIACTELAVNKVLPALEKLSESIKKLSEKNKGIYKSGRTHMQDATPVAFSDETEAWRVAVETAEKSVKCSLDFLKKIPLGGTAVGSGINTPPSYSKTVVKELSRVTGFEFKEDNKFHGLAFKDALTVYHSALKTAAVNLNKIANDVRLLSSGPRTGIGEITIPANEPGSSIMPGKVNPTQCEAVTMVFCEILGNDMAVSSASSSGQLELNVYMPLIAFKCVESSRLLSDVALSFAKNCMDGIKVNREKMDFNLKNSLMLATAFTPVIGYDKCSEAVKLAFNENISLKEAVLKLNLLDEKTFDSVLEKAIKY